MKKILIANRGEIALRVMRTAHRMGIPTVAVYSAADRKAPHVREAGEAVCLGPAPSAESYLDMDKVLAAARQTGADAIHPGYGFLSENAEFAEKAEAEGITFIGPRPHAIRVMGSKLAAKEAVRKYGIPMVPGIEEAIVEVEAARKVAAEIGFPILIKASAGGGGKGMRVVEHPDELPEQMERAIGEATSAFGDGSVFIEKYVASPRHIEIQVLADTQGNAVHLFERECSIQRRHQKVLEEAPSVVLSPALREEMGAAALKVAKACDYVGAGTVEFLLDRDGRFYFLEMNTRLQVEHPVTEMITGIDLVEQQIRVARGERLALGQQDLRIEGHALELRVYAEDPTDNFMPGVGMLETYERPVGPGIRVDDGYEAGMEIPIFYDSMIAKLIVHAGTRPEALRKMREAIGQYKIKGIATTLPFGRFVCGHEAFAGGDFDTHFVKKHYAPEQRASRGAEGEETAAAMALHLFLEEKKQLKTFDNPPSPWQQKR